MQNIQKENVSGQVHNKTQPLALIYANLLCIVCGWWFLAELVYQHSKNLTGMDKNRRQMSGQL